MSRFPDFFIVGAPKSATTSLYYYLDQHPQVYMSRVKEPHFFAEEIREENCDAWVRGEINRDRPALRRFLAGSMSEKRVGGIVEDWQTYLGLFAGADDHIAIGEASPCYLWSPSAARRIADKIPQAKILVMLRDPVERAFSQYLHGLGNGAIHWSLREHIRRNQSHRSGQFAVHYPFLEFGLYSEQLRHYLARFGANVWVGFYEDFRTRPLEVYQNVCRRLGVAEDFSPDMGRKHLQAQVPRTRLFAWMKRRGLWRAAAAASPSSLRPIFRRAVVCSPGETRMCSADRQYLLDYYREDVCDLADLLAQNRHAVADRFPAWLTGR